MIVSLIMQEELKKVRTLSVRKEETVSRNGACVGGDCCWVYTCDVRLAGDGLSDSG